MKKPFLFIFILSMMIFLSSCHDENGLTGIIDKSANQKTGIASGDTKEKKEEPVSRLEELMRQDPNIRKIIEILEKSK